MAITGHATTILRTPQNFSEGYKMVKNITCPECGEDGNQTIFPDDDKRLWRCDECGYVVFKRMVEW